MLCLQLYDFTILHRAERIHQNADALSRMVEEFPQKEVKNEVVNFDQKAADIENAENEPNHGDEVEVFEAIAQEYFTENDEIQGTGWTNQPEWMNWEAGSDDGVSDTEYSYEDYEGDNSGYSSEEYEWELANSQRARDRFQKELLWQLAYELWEEVTWARQGGYHLNESPTYSSTR